MQHYMKTLNVDMQHIIPTNIFLAGDPKRQGGVFLQAVSKVGAKKLLIGCQKYYVGGGTQRKSRGRGVGVHRGGANKNWLGVLGLIGLGLGDRLG
jgi:hypothetical protein